MMNTDYLFQTPKEEKNPPAGIRAFFSDVSRAVQGIDKRRCVPRKRMLVLIVAVAAMLVVLTRESGIHAYLGDTDTLPVDELTMTQALWAMLEDGRLERTFDPIGKAGSTCPKDLSARGQKTHGGPLCANGCGSSDCTDPESEEAEGGKDWPGDFLYQTNCAHCVYFQTAGFPPGTIFQWGTRSKESDSSWYMSLKPCSKPVEKGLAYLPIDDPSLVKCFHSLPATVKKAEMNALAMQLNKVGQLIQDKGEAAWPHDV